MQHEIISKLQDKSIPYIILKHIFADEALEREKRNFLRHLPNIGAMQLDEFIMGNYTQVRSFGPYVVWKRKEAIARDGA